MTTVDTANETQQEALQPMPLAPEPLAPAPPVTQQQALQPMPPAPEPPAPPVVEEPEATPASKKSKKKAKAADDETNLEFTWICTECKEAECLDEADAPLLICEGQCARPFHPPCANLAALPPEDVPWSCDDCAAGRHQCVACKEYGEDDVDVFCCDAKGCGLFFHEHCLSVYSVDVRIVEEEVPVEKAQESENGEEKKQSNDDVSSDGSRFSAPPNDSKEVARETKLISRPKFKCPAHQCWTCAGDIPPNPNAVAEQPAEPPAEVTPEKGKTGKGKGKGKKGGRGKKRKGGASGALANMWGSKKERLFRCLECPLSYHLTCMPPSCSFHELAMLCHEHAPTSKLPYLDAEYSFQAEVEKDVDKKIEAMRRKAERRAAREEMDEVEGGWESEEENAFFPGLVGSVKLFEEEQLEEYFQTTKDDNDNGGEEDPNRKRRKRFQNRFCLPVDFRDEVHSKPPAYTHVNANRYNPQNRPKRHPPTGESCTCKPSTDEGAKPCDHRCLNRLGYVECVGDKALKSGEKNPYWNCNCGPTCGNRAMSKRQFAKCRPMREHGKGWGLVAVNGVKKGDLVQEYAGEVIDEATKEERLRQWSRDHPNDPNFYVMHLEPGWYIDAREVANMARFINHSCDPNCKLVPVNVGGHMRVSIVCIRDVPPGGFLNYDYHFDTLDGEKFICRCGASNCRGTMKGGKGEGADEKAEEKKTKRQLLSDAKARIQRDKKFLKEVADSEKERLHLTGPVVPGSDAENPEMVAGGPKERYHLEAQEGRVFLWRNARLGGDFSSRYWRTLARRRGGKKSRQALASQGTVDMISVVKEQN